MEQLAKELFLKKVESITLWNIPWHILFEHVADDKFVIWM